MHGDDRLPACPPGHSVLSVQLFLAVFAVPAILLAALVEELRGTNDRLSTVLDGISDGYYTLDRDRRIVAVNAKGAAWCGHSHAGRIDRSRLLGDPRATRSRPGMGPRARYRAGRPFAARFSLPDGRWSEIHAYPSADGLSIFCHDISEQRAAERSARNTRAPAAVLARRVDCASHDSRQHRRDHRRERRLAESRGIAGPDRRALFRRRQLYRGMRRSRPHQRMVASGLRASPCRVRLNEFRCEYASDIVEGSWIQLRCTRFGFGTQLRLVVACEDITEVKATEASLRRLTAKLLSRRTRRGGASRANCTMRPRKTCSARRSDRPGLASGPEAETDCGAALEESRAFIEQSQREIRTVSYLLHPPMLDEAGLPAALRWLCEGFSKRTDIASI